LTTATKIRNKVIANNRRRKQFLGVKRIIIEVREDIGLEESKLGKRGLVNIITLKNVNIVSNIVEVIFIIPRGWLGVKAVK